MMQEQSATSHQMDSLLHTMDRTQIKLKSLVCCTQLNTVQLFILLLNKKQKLLHVQAVHKSVS